MLYMLRNLQQQPTIFYISGHQKCYLQVLCKQSSQAFKFEKALDVSVMGSMLSYIL